MLVRRPKISSAFIPFDHTAQTIAHILTPYIASISLFTSHSSIAFIIHNAYAQRAHPHEITKIFLLGFPITLSDVFSVAFFDAFSDFHRGHRDGKFMKFL
jgi:hypothetical protein